VTRGSARRLLAVAACAVGFTGPVAAVDLRAVELRVDNDQFGFTGPSEERWYTSGVFLQGAVDAGPDAPDARLAAAWCVRIVACDPGARTLRVLSLSQRIHTPQLMSPSVPRPFDWPFGASLALGSAIVVDGARTRQALGLELGAIGPAALGGPVQNALHRIIGQPRVEGWDDQVRAQPLVQLTWYRLSRHRLDAPEGMDAVLRTGLRLGNPLTQAELGAMLRFGRRPEGPAWPGESIGVRGRAGWHGFVGVEAAGVAPAVRRVGLHRRKLGDGVRMAARPRAGAAVGAARRARRHGLDAAAAHRHDRPALGARPLRPAGASRCRPPWRVPAGRTGAVVRSGSGAAVSAARAAA
jgi:hypothetical protein